MGFHFHFDKVDYATGFGLAINGISIAILGATLSFTWREVNETILENGNKHFDYTVEKILKDNIKTPLDLAVIPNHMGINLCSVEGMCWDRQPDGQLVSLGIWFIPAPNKPTQDEPKYE